MTNRTIKHEVKFQPSVIIIFGLLALGICANVFVPTFTVKDAMAELFDGSKLYIHHSGRVSN